MSSHNLFDIPKPPTPQVAQPLYTEAEREAMFRKAYADCLDGKGRRVGKAKGDALYERFEKTLADLETSHFMQMRRKAREEIDISKFQRDTYNHSPL
jgi:hypothetical protein